MCKRRSIFQLKLLVLVFSFGVIVTESKPPIFTAREKADIDRLRQAVVEKLTMEYMRSDVYLIRWLKAKKFDYTKAKEALQQTLEWRNSVDADNIPNHTVESDMEKNYVVDSNTARDKAGNSITIFPFGNWNVRRKMLERNGLTVRPFRFNSTGDPTTMLIVDMNGFALRTHSCTKCVAFILNWAILHELHYPYNFYRIFLINTPKIFDPIFTLMKPLMSAPTKEAARILGYDRREHADEISKFANLDDIPVRFGGNKIKSRDKILT